MDWTLEVVVVPVADLERAVLFYTEQVGFVLDFDTSTPKMRLVQLTTPGSACSISLGTVRPSGAEVGAEPGSIRGLQLVVSDIEAARAELVGRGVDVTSVQRIDPRDGGAFMHFRDPDGNEWTIQEIRARAGV